MSESGDVDGERELPAGWVWVELGDLLDRIEAGKSFTCEPRRALPEEWGVIKVSAMTWGAFDPDENKAVPAGRDFNPDYEISSGDLLVSRANTKAYVGAPVLVGTCRPRLLLSDKSLRLVPHGSVSKRWLLHFLRSPKSRAYVEAKASGTKDAMRNLSQEALRRMPVALPPLAEQRRIVEALEEQLSRIDSGVSTLLASRKRLEGLRKRVLVSAIPDKLPESWRMTTVEDAGTLELGRARHPDWHRGPEMRPYLRVANVFEDRIDTSDVMEMDFSGVWEKYRLKSGDVLLNEGQSPHLVGRPALYRGVPDGVAFTNSLIRFQAGDDVLPEWALIVFRRHLHAKRFMREVRITTNIAHLSAKRLKNVEFPVPPLAVQKRIVQRCDELLSGIAAMDQQVETGLRRARTLKSALLRRAFTGGLVPQDSDEEPAAPLVARIAAERAAQPRAKRTRKTTAKPPAQRVADATAPEPTAAPALAVQQEFEL
ncbi:restriction endonuclease subunit S [Streptomyces olivaceus]|uniref:restriction endonuclease subunit S n=1 Tax=Streptomyces olivaceus TaxID=47716 RepID=UPI001CCF9A98|nr:restriction endonuclease subunit S [Streptomyces olivaceus]MBZ6285750.1 restriction endonuclease subunit S [Streptomyces olivaceus]